MIYTDSWLMCVNRYRKQQTMSTEKNWIRQRKNWKRIWKKEKAQINKKV
jgi:hypothetical protein